MGSKQCPREFFFPVFRRKTAACGFSLVELLVVIGVLAILAALGVVAMTGAVSSTKWSTAEANLDLLNHAVLEFNQAVSELTNTTNSGITDEQAIFTNLQARDAVSRPGSPYLAANFTVRSSTNTSTYRGSWNGRLFEIIGPGTNGTGLDLLKMQ